MNSTVGKNMLFCQASRAERPPLRVGLLLDTTVLPRCHAEILDQIRASNFARLELVIAGSSRPPAVRERVSARQLPHALGSTFREPRKLLFNLYKAWDGRHVTDADPLTPTDCADRLLGVPSVTAEPPPQGSVDPFSKDLIKRIRDFDLDVLIRFGPDHLRGDILQTARFGVWSYHYGDADSYRGGPNGFWEVYERNPLTGAMLQRLSEDRDTCTVLSKCVVPTSPGLSLALNRSNEYWASNDFIVQKLRQLHEQGWDFVQSRTVMSRRDVGRKPVYTSPTNWEMVRWLAPAVIKRVVQRIARRPQIRHWNLALRVGTNSLLDQGDTPDLRGFRGLTAPPGRFYADPFLTEHAGRKWLFFEDFDCSINRGRISATEVSDEGEIGETIPVLARPHHLSYPCLFNDGQNMFMIPETGSNGTVDLYRCCHFPDLWIHEKELFRGRAVDTTVWVQDGLYWFFVTLKDPRGRFQQLWLFYAKSLTGAWTPHPANPVSCDVRNNRGAGALFRHNGKLIRPGQDGSGRYGRNLTFNEILALTPERYEERPVITVKPMNGFVGTHTYSRIAGIEVIDECTLVPVESPRQFRDRR